MNDSEIIRKLKNREEEGLRGLIRAVHPLCHRHTL